MSYTHWKGYRTQLILLCSIILCQDVIAQSMCKPSSDCITCLAQGPDCTWCYQMDYSMALRCDTVENHKSRGCEITSAINPESKQLNIQNETVRNADLDAGNAAIQISPQKLKLTVYPGRPVTIPITYRIAEDYPVDLYYIMDSSYSMLDDRDNLISLGELIAQELKKITKDVRLGFGAFVDKAAMPFAGVREVSIKNPCYPKTTCDPMYGFKNQLSLTSNISTFGQRVRETPISGNQDGPEGGMDALLQAMACNRHIGWRNLARKLVIYASDQHVHVSGDGRSEIDWREGSRKIIVFSADDKSHISGDAKLAGILEPNDGHCHLHNNEYTYTLKQDYPSVSQVALLAKSTSTNIIFAVSNFVEEYRHVSDLIPSSVVGELASDSSNIVALVREQYESLIKTVEIVTSGLSLDDGVSVKIKSKCQGESSLKDSNKCTSVGIGETIEFEAEISVSNCTESKTKTFSIKPSDLADTIDIELEMVCDCPCDDAEENSPQCSGVGTYKCGVCSCNDGFTGESCECDSKTVKAKTACVNPLTNRTCSGFGECDNCGGCQCDCLPGEEGPTCTRYSGPFCNCNTKSCDYRNGEICAGNGKCVCDHPSTASYCECKIGFGGNDCSCPLSDVGCRAENGTGEVCNGRGQCSCGVCECTDACFEGQTCEIRKPECSRTCISFRNCVACKVKPQKAVDCSDESICDEYKIDLVDELSTDDACIYNDDENCKHFYKYEYNHNTKSWTVRVLKEAKCVKDYWLEVIIGLCIGILILGILALIIWKIVVTVHDKREYARFEKERQNAQWKSTNNPLYQPATSTYRNPMYAGAKAAKPPPPETEAEVET